MKNGRRQFAMLALFTISVIALSLYANVRVLTKPPPLVYDVVTIVGPDAVCAGDTLTIRIEGRITEAPVAVMIIHNVADTTTGRNVVADRQPDWRLLDRVRAFVNPAETYTLPDDIAPGAYEFRIGAQGLQTRLAVGRAPFTVREDCD